MYQIVVCDDCREDADLLIECISRYDVGKQAGLNISYFKSGEELLDKLKRNDFGADMIFLDIIMDGCDGIETARMLREFDKKIPIVYLTTSRDFAIDSYEVEAAGYLLKPFDEERIIGHLDKVLDKAEKKRLAVKFRGTYRYLDYDDIRYLESKAHSINIYLQNETVAVVGKLNDLEKQLSDIRFLRCHQSFLVNMDYVCDIGEYFLLRDGSRVPIRIKEKRKIAEQYYRYFVNKNLN